MEFHGNYNLKIKIALALIQGNGELVGVAGKSFRKPLNKKLLMYFIFYRQLQSSN